jgi:hypothetical protein
MKVSTNNDDTISISSSSCENWAIVNDRVVEYVEMLQEDDCACIDEWCNDMDTYLFSVINSHLSAEEKERRTQNLMEIKNFFRSVSTKEVDKHYEMSIL